MKHRLTFANVIGVLLENKKKTYPQHQMIRTLFSAYLDDELTGSELIAEDNTMYSRWCNGARPIPLCFLSSTFPRKERQNSLFSSREFPCFRRGTVTHPDA